MSKIIQITDCHLFADPQKAGYNNIKPFQSLKEVLAKVKLQNPDRLIATGDISGDGSAESYQHFIQLVREAKLGNQLSVIPGNHDNQTHMKQYFSSEQLWLNNPYVVVNNNWHIHLLDSQYQQTIGRISDTKLHSLQQYLQLYKHQPHMVAVHHHPISCGGWMDKHEWENRQNFIDLVAKHPQVKGVIYGHIHMDIETNYEQCLYMACPSTCWQFSNSQTFNTNGLTPGFRVLNLSASGQINTSVQRL